MSASKRAFERLAAFEDAARENAVALVISLSRAIAWAETSDLSEEELYWLNDAKAVISKVRREQ